MHGPPELLDERGLYPFGFAARDRVSMIRARKTAAPENATPAGAFPFVMFCIFMISYFLHLTQRLPALGAMRFDLLLGAVTFISVLFNRPTRAAGEAQGITPIGKWLLIVIGYMFASLPFVEWPGSVLNKGLEPFLKAVCFYLFVTSTVNTLGRLKTLTAIFVACQAFRILEPLYLHVTTGYWGSFTYLGDSEFMDRLSGAPFDIINSNGLGFLIVLTIPLLHFLIPPTSAFRKICYAAVTAAFLYALVLSASRSSFLALIVLVGLAIMRSKRRATYLAIAMAAGMVSLAMMTDLQRERYVSIYSHSAKGSATAEGRLSGVIADFGVAMHRPLFGHGLGNSREANANFGGVDQLSHNLYSEVAQELGFIGLALFLGLLVQIVRQCYRMRTVIAGRLENDEIRTFFERYSASLLLAVQVLIFFSLASYGLSEPYWYFLGGLVTAAAALAAKYAREGVAVPATTATRGQLARE
jgi:putative inorganic carbon (hco3(-)) transporter